MSYVILWLAHLAWGLLLVAVVVALASRCKKPRWRKFWPILAAIVIFVTFAAIATAGAFLLVFKLQPKWLFWYGLTHTIAYIIGTIIILKRGLKGINSESQVGHFWPRARLAVAFSSVLFVYFVTLNFIDTRVMIDVSNLRTEATSKISQLIPPLLPDTFNAHPVYEQAAKSLSLRDEMRKWFKRIIGPDFDPASHELTRFLEKNKTVLAMVRQAASMPGYSLQVDATNILLSPIAQFSVYRDLARLLSISARCKALSGDLAGALHELAVIEGMAEHVQSFPDVISSMIAVALYKTKVEGLEHVLASTADYPKGLIGLPVNAHPSSAKSFAKSLSFESKVYLQILTMYAIFPESLETKFAYVSIFNCVPVSTILVQLWRIFLLPSELNSARDIDTYLSGEPSETYKDVHEDLKAIEEAKESGDLGPFTYSGTPNFTFYMVRVMKCDALRGLSDLALAVTAFKADKGRYPDNLIDLVPDYIEQIPTDPFVGQALKMRPLDGGVDLYSVGPDPELELPTCKGPIHFYLGRSAYQQYRIKPTK